MNTHEITPEVWELNSIFLEEKFKDESVWDSVPLYNFISGQNLKDYQMVRFIGMVQDILDPEIYLKRFEVRDQKTGETSMKSGMYRDFNENWHTTIVEDSVHNERDDRSTFYCVSIPGVNQWISKIRQTKTSELLASLNCSGPTQDSNRVKRSYEEMNRTPEESAEGVAREELVAVEDPDGSIQRAKRELNEAGSLDASLQHRGGDIDLNHPLKDPNAKACYIKIYDWDSDKYKLNDMVDVVGFISNDPYMSMVEADDGLDRQLPPSQAPRLHVVMMRKITQINPLVGAADKEAELATAGATFKELLHLFTQITMGDELCAEYIIYSIVATVFDCSNEETLGQLPLNVFNVPCNLMYAEKVYSILQELVEKSHFMKLNISNLNEKTMIPSKAYDQNLLKSGELQLTENTVLFIDETKLEEGQLVNSGCLNFAALKSVCEKQAINYDFTYYSIEFKTNLSVLVFSAGRSLLPCSLLVKMEPSPDSVKNMEVIFEAAKFLGLREMAVAKFRKYLTIVQHTTFDISEEIQETLEESFVKFRKEDKSFVVPDFHRLLVIARLASLCRGELALTQAAWHAVIELERKRKERLN